MNIYRVLLFILIGSAYAALFWVVPFLTDAGMEGVAIMHGAAASCACFVFVFVWLLDRC